MTHDVDGFDLKFTSRTSWKAERRLHGQLLDVIPVTWTKGFKREKISGDTTLTVWFQKPSDLEYRQSSRDPFVVALAIAHNYEEHPHRFKEFRAIYEVVATGTRIDHECIETRVLRRLSPRSP